MDMNSLKKKAVLFSLISLLFSALFITLFSQGLLTVNEDRIISTNVRVKVIDTYVRNFEVYAGDSLKVSTYRGLDAITVLRDGSGKFFSSETDFRNAYTECMMCGYTNCTTETQSCNMQDNHLAAKLDNIIELSRDELNINTSYNINSIFINQTYPFEITVYLNITYNISDLSGMENYAKWDRQSLIVETVPIYGLLDPLGYMSDASNTYDRRINGTQVCNIGEDCWTISTTSQFYDEYSFRYYSNGTSFLQRYWNSSAPSDCCGIETIIHPAEIAGINQDNSYIDHYYWNGSYVCKPGNDIVTVTLGSEEVHFDEIGAARYGITQYSVLYCRI